MIHDSVVKIGSYALSNTKLADVRIPEGIIETGSHAFSGTRPISVTIPGGLVEISEGMFKNCCMPENVVISPGTEKYEPTLSPTAKGCRVLRYPRAFPK